MKLVIELQKNFEQHTNKDHAVAMSVYMKNKFDFWGIKSPERKNIFASIYKSFKPENREACEDCIIGLYSLKQREFHYCAMDLANRFFKKPLTTDIYIIEYMLEYNQWWDTIDFIASNLVGRIFSEYPDIRDSYFEKWNNDKDMWLNRTAILFQLKYKENVNTELLIRAIRKHKQSKEFFHQKAIGWSLREYAKFNPQWVVNFVKHEKITGLARREALKHLNSS